MKLTTLVYFTILLGCASCVSVNLGGHSAKHATGVTYQQPKGSFAPESRDDVDAAWKDSKNGNLISYISDCQDDSDPALDSVVQGALEGLNELHYESTQSPLFQEREARRVLASGKVDGVPSKIDLLAFKRNRCIYILTYVGVAKSFEENHSQFEHFVQGFRAP